MAALYAATYPGANARSRALPAGCIWGCGRNPGRGGGMARQDARGGVDARLLRRTSRGGHVRPCTPMRPTASGIANSVRVGASPAVAYALNRARWETDLRDVWAAIRVPTLVLHRGAWGHDYARVVVSTIPERAGDGTSRRRLRGHFPLSGARRRARRFRRRPRAGRSSRHSARRRSSSRTSSTPRPSPLASATVPGRSSSVDTTRSSGASSLVSVARRRDTAGDGFFATFDGPARAIRCAQARDGGRPRPSARGSRRCSYRRVRTS